MISPTNIAILLCALFLTRFLIYPIFRALFNPLRSIPGPLFARLSRLYYLHGVSTGSFHHTNLALHKRYGPVVRLAPNLYSLDSPLAIKAIYSIKSNYAKSDWYDGWRHPDPNKNSIFPQRDVQKHAETRKLFQGLYTLSTVVAYESYVDECTDIFMRRLQQFARDEESLNIGHWFQCYAFDVIADITYSERFGFLDTGEDVDGVFKALWSSMWYSSLIGVYPEWHPRLYGLMEKVKGSGAAARTYILTVIGKMVQKRKMAQAQKTADKNGEMEIPVSKDTQEKATVPEDFLSKMMKAQQLNPEKVTDFHVFMMGIANVFAGSDTTAASLSATLYYLLRNPRTMGKLRKEIAHFSETSGGDRISFKESLEMPYLQAVLKEAMRLHAATGLPLWRVVPAPGAEICGVFFPGGSVVGVNTWVAHYNKDVFGEDAAEFRPERWMEADAEGGEKAKQMEAYYFPVSFQSVKLLKSLKMNELLILTFSGGQFGLGSRTCLGKYISILEMSKLVPQIVTMFEFELQGEWKTENFLFVKPLDFLVKIKSRGE
jgi:cytochrome P450